MISESVNSILARQQLNEQEASGASQNIVDKDGFLKLLMAQMQHQDPFSPMDNGQMMSQMAQFSSLEQMQGMNANLASSLQWDLLFNQTINNTMATSLIGREVEALGNEMVLGKTGDTSFKYDLKAFAHTMKVDVLDEAGHLVYSEAIGPKDSGTYDWTWDGHDDEHQTVAGGVYYVVLRLDGERVDTHKAVLLK